MLDATVLDEDADDIDGLTEHLLIAIHNAIDEHVDVGFDTLGVVLLESVDDLVEGGRSNLVEEARMHDAQVVMVLLVIIGVVDVAEDLVGQFS